MTDNAFVESDERQALRKSVAAMAANYGQDYYLEKARAGQHTDELWQEAGKLGFIGVNLPEEYGGGGAGMYELSIVMEEMSAGGCPLLLMVVSPAINGTIIAKFGTDEQKKRWLEPLLAGEIRSAFAMTEPEVASSDATNIETRITRDGGDYVINGRKWYISGALHPDCEIFIVMGKTDPDGADIRRQQSQILVPRDTPGLTVKRAMQVYGYEDHWHGGHAEVVFEDVRVPAANLIGEEGGGFAIAQARLGPGRIHHCMRLIGMAERAIELMCRRAVSRTAFGKPLAQQGVVQNWIADARVTVEQLRLLVLKTAWLMDTVGNRGAHTEIQSIKIATPRAVVDILDRAVQLHGAGGVSQDFPLAALWSAARTLRLADGPDEVHRQSLARRELRKYAH